MDARIDECCASRYIASAQELREHEGPCPREAGQSVPSTISLHGMKLMAHEESSSIITDWGASIYHNHNIYHITSL
jgi:hypothetical protein